MGTISKKIQIGKTFLTGNVGTEILFLEHKDKMVIVLIGRNDHHPGDINISNGYQV